MLSDIFLRFSPLFIVTVKGNSMSPTLKNKETVLTIQYWFIKPKLRDIVLCKHPITEKLLIKRLIKQDKSLFWIEGDNKEESTDSRDFGWVERKFIIGKVIQTH